ncbi:DUF4349 domain-containing protein [Streptomyces sp. N2A]|uniref:DUF4349 domain-containing protein n=1 Tax=Streptomyces sp. N2A TaxID=3073936 RepID=UPI0028700195|nr:DUF4349 domain-containing protein [Streptomyces sp. N2A]
MRGTARAGRTATAGLLLAVALSAAGCSASAGPDTTGAALPGKAAPSRAAADGRAGADDGRAGARGAAEGAVARPGGRFAKVPTAASSQLVRTATLTVQAEDVSGAVARARAVVDGAGGYPAAETTDREPEGQERSRLVLRVPTAEYDAVMGRLARLGTVVSRRVSAKDVTDQVVDVDSRVRTQRASVARVRALMEKATSIGDIVSLESELSSRQADLESLEAQLTSLKDRTAMATVTLLLRQPDAAPDGASDDDARSFGDALSGGWHAFLAAVKWLLVALGAVLPFAVAVGLLYGLWRQVRGRLPSAFRRRTRAADTRDGPGPAAGEHAADDGPANAPGDPDRTVPAGEGDRGPR